MLDKDDDLMKICPDTAREGREPNWAVTTGWGTSASCGKRTRFSAANDVHVWG